jgi:ribosomal protein S18 acetylase RimI-like enzyme
MSNSKKPNVSYREAVREDIPVLAQIRAKEWESEEYWLRRIAGYMDGTANPWHSMAPRIVYAACEGDVIVGFIAGHLTTRLGCEGELEWIDVVKEHRRKGIATEMVRVLARWFVARGVFSICVDPGNEPAREFYRRNGAGNLNNHWMYWEDIRSVIERE